MRRVFILACVLLLILAACQGGNDPSIPTLIATNTPPTPDPTATEPEGLGPDEGTIRPSDVVPTTPTATNPADAATVDAINQAAGTAGASIGVPSIEAPEVGTIQVAAVTEDPDVGAIFDEIYFSQTGGPERTTLVVQVYPDGRVLRDGVQYQISADQVAEIDNALDAMNFFGMQGNFTSPGGGRDTYVYEISVSRGDDSRNVAAEDGLIPPELMTVFSLLLDAGLSRPGS
jgi:hypothetical protein